MNILDNNIIKMFLQFGARPLVSQLANGFPKLRTFASLFSEAKNDDERLQASKKALNTLYLGAKSNPQILNGAVSEFMKYLK